MQISSRGWALEYLILSYWEIPQIRINKWTYVPETCSFPFWKWSFLWGQSGTYVIIRWICIRMKKRHKIARFRLFFAIRWVIFFWWGVKNWKNMIDLLYFYRIFHILQKYLCNEIGLTKEVRTCFGNDFFISWDDENIFLESCHKTPLRLRLEAMK